MTSAAPAKKGLIRQKYVIKCTGRVDELSMPPAQKSFVQERKGERLSMFGG